MHVSDDIRRFAMEAAAAGECANFARARSAALQELAAGWHATASNVIAPEAARHAVAIPVRNEAHRLVACIASLAAQRDARGRPFPDGHLHVVLMFNNCSDAGYTLVKNHLGRWPIALTAYDMSLPDGLCHAGHARRVANHVALRGLPADGVLFMTDADSRVPADWVARYTALLENGCDAVAGMAELSPDDHADIPCSLMQRSALEDRYARLLDELESIVDPLAYDPWPRHYAASGANMAVRAGIMRTLDGFPDMACGEDRRLLAMLERADWRVRHDTHTRVFTSGRLFGRAVGGKADTLRHRVLVPEAACDERLESAEAARYRATLRAMLRNAWHRATRSRAAIDILAAEAGIAAASIRLLLDATCFGEAWHRLESSAARLQRSALAPSRLPAEIRHCEDMIDALRHGCNPVADSQRELIA